MDLPKELHRWNPAIAGAFQKGMAAHQNGQSVRNFPYSVLAAFTANGERWRPFQKAWCDGWYWAAQQEKGD